MTLTDALAFYGAIVATFGAAVALFVAWLHYTERRYDVHLGVASWPEPSAKDQSVGRVVTLEVANVGLRPLFVTNVFLATAKGPLMIWTPNEQLEPNGKPWTVQFLAADIVLKAQKRGHDDPAPTRLSVLHTGGRSELDLRAAWKDFPDSAPGDRYSGSRWTRWRRWGRAKDR